MAKHDNWGVFGPSQNARLLQRQPLSAGYAYNLIKKGGERTNKKKKSGGKTQKLPYPRLAVEHISEFGRKKLAEARGHQHQLVDFVRSMVGVKHGQRPAHAVPDQVVWRVGEPGSSSETADVEADLLRTHPVILRRTVGDGSGGGGNNNNNKSQPPPKKETACLPTSIPFKTGGKR